MCTHLHTFLHATHALKAAVPGLLHVLAHTSTPLVEHTPTRTPLPAGRYARADRTRSPLSATSVAVSRRTSNRYQHHRQPLGGHISPSQVPSGVKSRIAFRTSKEIPKRRNFALRYQHCSRGSRTLQGPLQAHIRAYSWLRSL